MNQRLKDVLSGQESNYMMPFFWMQDGKHADLRGGWREGGARIAGVAEDLRQSAWGDTWTFCWKRRKSTACGCGCWTISIFPPAWPMG